MANPIRKKSEIKMDREGGWREKYNRQNSPNLERLYVYMGKLFEPPKASYILSKISGFIFLH